MRFSLLFSCLLICLASFTAYAQQAVNVRGGDHDGYSRLVFDWPEKSGYTVSKSGDVITLSFDKAGTIDTSKVNQSKFKNIGTVSASSGSSSLDVSIKIVPQSEHRHFKVGKKVIVDVYDAKGAPSRDVTKTSQKEDKPEKETPPPPSQDDGLEVANDDPIEIKKGIERIVEEREKPHVLTVTSTEGVGMAVFEREGFVWLVLDNPALKISPVMSGPNKEKMPKPEKMDHDGALVYRMQKPEGHYLYGEGGGLLWRLVMTPNPRRTTPVKPVAKRISDSLVGGGTLFWPIQSARRVITIEDPLIGDEIRVTTVLDSSQFAGEARQYVDLEMLPSVIGAAFVPKSDGVAVTADAQGVVVTKPQGLAISPERDTAAVLLRDDVQKEEDFFDAEENPYTMARIFDFDRWEMGGLESLEENRRIIMKTIGNKKGASKVEDLITLAKLNVANDRGQEALGLLRVAAEELPGIDQNTEFIALEGAAAALAGKNDIAIEDFFSPALKEYGEINYWKAFTLAGLEDWQQANKVMPKNFDVLNKYPEQIKRPIMLALSEVALRGAKKDTARELLGFLEEDFDEMSFAQQAKWKYLNGEFERQAGSPKQALKNWNDLLDGNDDYFRAKAGLSVTKMQLARQKITPEKAIDRLEGLRYAWRGDELETLINYRLGEVYIDNENYLKGLSILRNAVSLSPDAKITNEVTDYMTETFQSLFKDGKLKEVSPIDAVSIYDEFKELTPLGREGDIFIQELAERLVDVDLLGRAASLLEHQMEHRLQGSDKVKVAIRLAAIRLLDNNPETALEALDVGQQNLPATSEDGVTLSRQKRELTLLKARALSKIGRASEGLALLRPYDDDTDVLKLKTDIAWADSQWDVAANAFGKLIEKEDISQTRPMNEYQTSLVLNRGIALNLAGNRQGLAGLRNEYKDLMLQSDKARLFNLVTRERKLGMIANKESVSSLISEVDLFGEFLENYRTVN